MNKPKTSKREKPWNACGSCGRFIAWKDIENGATRTLVTPDSHFSVEEWENTCKKCADKKNKV